MWWSISKAWTPLRHVAGAGEDETVNLDFFAEIVDWSARVLVEWEAHRDHPILGENDG